MHFVLVGTPRRRRPLTASAIARVAKAGAARHSYRDLFAITAKLHDTL